MVFELNDVNKVRVCKFPIVRVIHFYTRRINKNMADVDTALRQIKPNLPSWIAITVKSSKERKDMVIEDNKTIAQVGKMSSRQTAYKLWDFTQNRCTIQMFDSDFNAFYVTHKRFSSVHLESYSNDCIDNVITKWVAAVAKIYH